MASVENGAIVVRWGNGRTNVQVSQGMGVLAGALGHYDQLQKDGRITGYRVYASVTGTITGMLVIEGKLDELAKLLIDSENLKHQLLGSLVVEDLDVQLMAGGSADDATTYYVTGLTHSQAAGLSS
jgi:hypothetical protein